MDGWGEGRDDMNRVLLIYRPSFRGKGPEPLQFIFRWIQTALLKYKVGKISYFGIQENNTIKENL